MESRVTAVARKIATFLLWFNGGLAVVFDILMMVDPSGSMLGMDAIIPSLPDAPFLPDMFTRDLFWTGLALLLVNGICNLVGAILRIFRNPTWRLLSLATSILLLVWCLYEMLFIPNMITNVYFIIAIIQIVCSIMVLRSDIRSGSDDVQDK